MRIKELTGPRDEKLGPVPGQSEDDVEERQSSEVKNYLSQEETKKKAFDKWSND